MFVLEGKYYNNFLKQCSCTPRRFSNTVFHCIICVDNVWLCGGGCDWRCVTLNSSL